MERSDQVMPLQTVTPPDRQSSLWVLDLAADGAVPRLVLDGGWPPPDRAVLASWSRDGAHLLCWRNEGWSGSMLADGAQLLAVPVGGGPSIEVAGKPWRIAQSSTSHPIASNSH